MLNQMNSRSVVFNLIMINIVLFVASIVYPVLNQYLSLQYLFNRHDFVQLAANGTLSYQEYPTLYSFIERNYGALSKVGFLPVQILSHMFMHGGIAHIAFNMLGLFMFGNVLERVWGPKRFFIFYFTTGLGAVILHLLVQAIMVYKFTGTIDPTPAMLNAHPGAFDTYFSSTLGASGAIFGILIAFAMLFPNTELMLIFFPIPVKAKYLVSLYVIFELYEGFANHAGDDVAHFAHLGGALFGFILVKYWNRTGQNFY